MSTERQVVEHRGGQTHRTEPVARVKLVRADNAKTNGITIEIEGEPGELESLYETAFERFEAAIERMRKSDPQAATK